ncbi:MAG: DUF3782 domain-containing protein [Candidatus Methylumidiphilus sp.]
MTYEELKDLIASISVQQQKNSLIIQALSTSQQETERQMKETDRRMQETDRQMQETDRRMQETDRRMQETDRQMQQTDRMVKELGKQIGGLGEKFGSFTEGLALPSMQRILRERFGMEVVSPSVRVSKQGQHLEIDVLSYANTEINEAYVVEVKSHAREEAIEQLRGILERFHEFFPEHRGKKVYGILASVDVSAQMRERILKAGFYVARIHEQVFELDVPDDFKAKAY